MTQFTVLVSTWTDGVFTFAGGARTHELAGRAVQALADDGRGGVLAIVDAREVRRRDAAGEWRLLATADVDLACCVAVGDVVYLGTDDARVLALGVDGGIDDTRGLQSTAGRDTWYAGQALVDGRMMGPPLGVRSITATCDGAVLLANVHVGGIPRSTDGGASWRPTIDAEADVHEVLAHPSRPDVVVAAAAVGLCVSRDAGATWTVEREGLHATHCAGVAFVGEDVLVTASEDPFSPVGAVYRRPLDAAVALFPVGAGLPAWLEGRVDTRGVSTLGDVVAFADGGGHLYVSTDRGCRWSCAAEGLPFPSSVVVLA